MSGNVVRTAYDALIAKCSALDVGGYRPITTNEHFFTELLRGSIAASGSPISPHRRQSPLVNAGYAARLSSVTATVEAFVNYHETSSHSGCIQLVLLGCGLDVLGLWSHSLVENCSLRVIEVDFVEICREKAKILKGNGVVAFDGGQEADAERWDVTRMSGTPTRQGAKGAQNRYDLISCDLREVRRLDSALQSCVDSSLPTLVVTELVLAYLGKAGVEDLLSFCANTLCTSSYSAMMAFEVLGPSTTRAKLEGVLDGHRRTYCRQFVDRLSRGLVHADDEVFHPLACNPVAAEERLKQAGFGHSKAALAGNTVSVQLVAKEPFDEHSALAAHLSSYTLAVAFAKRVDIELVRALCPWSDVARAPERFKHAANIVLREITVDDQQHVRNMFASTYESLSNEYASVRKLVKGALKRDLAAGGNDTTCTIAKHYALDGGCFLVAYDVAKEDVVGFIGIRRLPASSAPETSAIFEINRLVVDDSRRRHRIGRSLLEASKVVVEAELRRQLLPPFSYRMMATTLGCLPAANGFYRNHGFGVQKQWTAAKLDYVTYEQRVNCTE